MNRLFRMFGVDTGAQPPCAVVMESQRIEQAEPGSLDPEPAPAVVENTTDIAEPACDIEADDAAKVLSGVLQAILNYQQGIENIHVQNCQNDEMLADRLSELTDAMSAHAESEAALREAVEQNSATDNARLQETILSPIFTDLINLHDGLLEFRGMSVDALPQNATEYLGAIIDDLGHMMIRYGLTPIPDPVGVMDPKFHRIVGVEQVLPPRDGEITKLEKGGFSAFGRVLRPVSVVVKKVV